MLLSRGISLPTKSLSRQTQSNLALSLLYSIKLIGVAKCFLEIFTKKALGTSKKIEFLRMLDSSDD